jgi:hypothetical protein
VTSAAKVGLNTASPQSSIKLSLIHSIAPSPFLQSKVKASKSLFLSQQRTVRLEAVYTKRNRNIFQQHTNTYDIRDNLVKSIAQKPADDR